jgi:hypothetical protein
MAVKKKTTAAAAVNEPGLESAIRDSIAQGVSKLYDRHQSEIEELRKESEKQKVTVNFGVELDFSESMPIVSVGIRFTKSYTDSVVHQIDDPSQGKFSEVVAEAEKQDPKRKRTKGDDGEAGA